jgi:hypothetical protein
MAAQTDCVSVKRSYSEYRQRKQYYKANAMDAMEELLNFTVHHVLLSDKQNPQAPAIWDRNG